MVFLPPPFLGEADLRACANRWGGGTTDELNTASRNPTGLGIRCALPNPASPYR